MRLKPLILIIIFCAFIPVAYAQICSDPFNVIYGLNQSGDIVPINVSDASVGSTINSHYDPGYPGSTTNSNGIGLDIQTSTFYYFQKNKESNYSTSKFVSYNTITHTYATLSNSPISGYNVRGCVTADGTGYYCLDGSNQLCYYNIASNSWKVIGSNLVDQYGNDLSSTLNNLGSGDIAIDGVGRLWIVIANASNWGIYMMDSPLPTTAQSSLLFNERVAPIQSMPTSSPFGGIAYNATGQIYMSTVSDLYLLNDDLTISHIGAFSTSGVGADLTSCNFPFGVLRVSWKEFTASLLNNNYVKLDWSINQDNNTHEYYIERSSDGQNWEEIGTFKNIPSGESMGNFTFLDRNPANGTNYYRIKVSDFSGKPYYSKIISQNIKGQNIVRIWPLPANSVINIETPGSGSAATHHNIRIISPTGQVIISSLLHGGTNQVNIEKLNSGVYIARIKLSDGTIVNKKIIKQ